MESDFCFIVGSFAYTAPNLRNASSDIDILSSENFSEEDIRRILLDKYPNLSKDVPLDISYRAPANLSFKIAYWQEEKCISLSLTNVKIHFIKTPIDIPNALRHPDKREFINYVTTSETIDFYNTRGLLKSIRHYGEEDFWKVVVQLPTKELFIKAYQLALTNTECFLEIKKIGGKYKLLMRY